MKNGGVPGAKGWEANKEEWWAVCQVGYYAGEREVLMEKRWW